MSTRKKHLSEAAFTQRCLGIMALEGFSARSEAPLALTITRGDYRRAHTLRNLYQSYLLEEPSQLDPLIKDYTQTLKDSLVKAAEARKEMSLEEGLRQLYPMLKQPSAVGDALHTLLAPGLAVVYAVDLPTAWRFVDAPLAESWGLSLAELHAKALENLHARTIDIEPSLIPGELTFTVYHAGDGFDAARALILDKLHPEAEAFTFAIPTRDQLLFIASGTLPEVFVDALRMQAEQDYDTMDHHLSPALWVWRIGEAAPVPVG